jgi:hypothetical protein
MKLLKILNVLRIVTFLATLLTTIPLFINYLKGVEPPYPLVTHLHVWFGLAFFIFAIISMILNKKQESKG